LRVEIDEERRGLRVLVADEDVQALEQTTLLLRHLGHEVTGLAVEVAEAADRIAREDPDLAVVVVHRDDEHALNLIDELNEYASGPVVALLHGHDPEFISRAAERGISAYASSATRESVQAAIDVAMARHAELRALEEHVSRLEGALERRAVIERAKGILMERHGLSEQQAFERIRSHARANNRRVIDVAEEIGEGRVPPDARD
jgi:AmiR/NasT family two-component response regulator